MSRQKVATAKSRRKNSPRAANVKRTTKGSRSSEGRPVRRKKAGTLTRVAKSVKSFMTDPDYPPNKAPRKGRRYRGELIA